MGAYDRTGVISRVALQQKIDSVKDAKLRLFFSLYINLVKQPTYLSYFRCLGAVFLLSFPHMSDCTDDILSHTEMPSVWTNVSGYFL